METTKDILKKDLEIILNELEFDESIKDIKKIKVLCIQNSSIRNKVNFLSNFSQYIASVYLIKKEISKIEFIWGKTYYSEKFAQNKDMRGDIQIMEQILEEEFSNMY
ncbi:hypothetical protein [Candidatus Harpocratesius sp.]